MIWEREVGAGIGKGGYVSTWLVVFGHYISTGSASVKKRNIFSVLWCFSELLRCCLYFELTHRA